MARRCTVLLSAHIRMQAKVKSRFGFLYRNRSSFTPAAKLTLIQMTILPMLDYADVIYRSAGKGALERLDALYNSSIRFATSAPYRTHPCTLCSSVNWSSLYTRRNWKVASSNPRADKVQICRSAPEQAVNPLFLGRH